jgi:hypothetical protein
MNAAALPSGHQQEQYRNVDDVEPRARSRLFFSKSFEATRHGAGSDIATVETLMLYIWQAETFSSYIVEMARRIARLPGSARRNL